MNDAVWNHAVFSKNRDRLLTSEVAQQFFKLPLQQSKRFMHNDHLTVDSTLLHALATHKPFWPGISNLESLTLQYHFSFFDG